MRGLINRREKSPLVAHKPVGNIAGRGAGLSAQALDVLIEGHLAHGDADRDVVVQSHATNE